MTRKDFLRAGIGSFVTVLVSAGLMKCGSSPTGPTPTTSKAFTSSSDNGHSHTFTIQNAEVQSPSAAGISGNTSSSGGHSHTFAMTQAQLQSVMGGASVVITSGISNVGGNHAHNFTIIKWF